jgi:ferredoxin
VKRREQRLRVDWPACHARGLCFELLPEVVRLDDWGYPVIDDAVPRHLVGQAREAVRACPTLALHLIKSQPAP